MKVGNYIHNKAKRIAKELRKNDFVLEENELFLEYNIIAIKQVEADLEHMYLFEPTNKQPQDEYELREFIIDEIQTKLEGMM